MAPCSLSGVIQVSGRAEMLFTPVAKIKTSLGHNDLKWVHAVQAVWRHFMFFFSFQGLGTLTYTDTLISILVSELSFFPIPIL